MREAESYQNYPGHGSRYDALTKMTIEKFGVSIINKCCFNTVHFCTVVKNIFGTGDHFCCCSPLDGNWACALGYCHDDLVMNSLE